MMALLCFPRAWRGPYKPWQDRHLAMGTSVIPALKPLKLMILKGLSLRR
jgi:hypothetical protein